MINKIKAVGTISSFVSESDKIHDIVKKEEVKCKKSFNSKNCIYEQNSITCKLNNCTEYKKKQYKISKVCARNVRKGDYILIPFNTKVKNSVIKDKYQAKFVGHLASDGSVSKKYKEVRICMNKKEINDVFPCVKIVYSNFGVNAKLKKCSSPHVLEARSANSELFEFSYSLVRGKGKKKRFTQEVILLKPELQLYVIGAYIQSDGTFNKINKCVEITTYSRYLANQLLILCFRCGILARGNRQPISSSKTTFKTKNIFRYIINIPSYESNKIKRYVPGKIKTNNFKKRKYNKRFFWNNVVVSPILSNKIIDVKLSADKHLVNN